MFKVNDTVMYGRNGVCVINDIKTENFGGVERKYYILTPAYDAHSTVYVPVESGQEKLKKLLSKKEICDIIAEAAHGQAQWIEDGKLRREKAKNVLKNGTHTELIQLIKLYRAKKAEFESLQKKFFMADEKVLQEAQNLLFCEFSAVLNIEEKDIFPLINGDIAME